MHRNNMNLSNKILSWYDNNKRTLPWRVSRKSKRSQYYRILSEFMLQQTQVKTVIPYFKNFIKQIPNLRALSLTSRMKILKMWEGLGYYRRVKNLHKTAKILVKRYDGRLPNKFDEINKLPGVGEYTANALLALVYNQPRIPFDGNVKRLFSRLFNISYKKNIKEKNKIIIKRFSTNRNADLAEALIEFGAIICKPKNPLCSICNIKANCYFFKNKTSIFTIKKQKKVKKIYNVYCYLKKEKKEIALTKNNNLSFLNNFNIPEAKVAKSTNMKKRGWIYFCSYKNNISNIELNINLFYKFTKNKPENFTWYYIDRINSEFIPSFTKKIFEKIVKVYL